MDESSHTMTIDDGIPKDGQKYVQVLEGDVTRDVSVEVGLRGDLDLEITSGLQVGQDVVTFIEE